MKIPTRIPSPKLRNVRHKSDPFRPSFCVREFYIKKLYLALENDKISLIKHNSNLNDGKKNSTAILYRKILRHRTIGLTLDCPEPFIISS